jgi:hypothetical protein
MKRLTEMFKTVEEAEAFAASLPAGSEQVVIPVKNTEDFRLGCTTAQCRTLWVNVYYNEHPLPWRR